MLRFFIDSQARIIKPLEMILNLCGLLHFGRKHYKNYASTNRVSDLLGIFRCTGRDGRGNEKDTAALKGNICL